LLLQIFGIFSGQAGQASAGSHVGCSQSQELQDLPAAATDGKMGKKMKEATLCSFLTFPKLAKIHVRNKGQPSSLSWWLEWS